MVVGSGLSGLYTAFLLSERGLQNIEVWEQDPSLPRSSFDFGSFLQEGGPVSGLGGKLRVWGGALSLPLDTPAHFHSVFSKTAAFLGLPPSIQWEHFFKKGPIPIVRSQMNFRSLQSKLEEKGVRFRWARALRFEEAGALYGVDKTGDVKCEYERLYLAASPFETARICLKSGILSTETSFESHQIWSALFLGKKSWLNRGAFSQPMVFRFSRSEALLELYPERRTIEFGVEEHEDFPFALRLHGMIPFVGKYELRSDGCVALSAKNDPAAFAEKYALFLEELEEALNAFLHIGAEDTILAFQDPLDEPVIFHEASTLKGIGRKCTAHVRIVDDSVLGNVSASHPTLPMLLRIAYAFDSDESF